MVSSPKKLKALCAEYGLIPSKRYGQNFLISVAPIKKMIAAAHLTPDDTVVEIGPGFGVLTLAVAPLVKKVVAFEIEKKLKPYWDEKQSEFKNVEVVWGNALTEVKSQKSKVKGLYKVMANLPYQITSHALRTLLSAEHKPERIVVMVQKEVAERICAGPPGMSLLSVSVQYYGQPKIVARVPRGNFWPPPKVDSAIVSIQVRDGSSNRRHPLLLGEDRGEVPEEAVFFRIVKAGFRNKRKQVWRNLASGLGIEGERVKAALKTVVGDERVRAEELGMEEWRVLAEALSRKIY